MMWRVIIIMLLVFMFVGAQLKETGEITQEQMDNVTERVSYDNLNLSTTFQDMGNDKNNTFLVRSIGKFADLYGFFTVEGARVALNFGYNNPKYNFGLAWRLMFLSCFAVLIMPLIYVVLFIGYGIYNIVNWIKSKRRNKKCSTQKKE